MYKCERSVDADFRQFAAATPGNMLPDAQRTEESPRVMAHGKTLKTTVNATKYMTEPNKSKSENLWANEQCL